MSLMAKMRWSVDKNLMLKSHPDRRACFEDVVYAIEMGDLLDDLPHPNQIKYPRQRILVVSISNYAYVVPYVREENGNLFLKTVFPSRALTKLYLTDRADDKDT